MKKQILFLYLAFLLPSAIAFNCNSLDGGNFHICQEIQNTNLTTFEKDLLISDLFNKNKTSPDFDFIYSWNTNLKIQAPDDEKYYSSGTIKNAWINIIALMPSVLENNTLYASNNGKLLTEFNYSFNLPSGKEGKDCATYYSWESKSSNLQVHLNNKSIGSEKLISYQIFDSPENLNFTSQLEIKSTYKVEHYRYKYIYDKRKCVFYSREYRTDNLKISDNFSAKLYKNNLNSSFKIINVYHNVTKGILEVDNYTSLILSFNNSNFQNQKYIYSLNYSLPYYILTAKAEPINEFNSNNIFVENNKNNFTFTVKDTSNCKIILYNYFDSETKDCDLSFNKTEISVKTDKINYFENETIRVYIFPENISVNISYGNESKIVSNYTEFNAILYENKIKAQLNNKEVSTLINVKKKENTIFLYNFGVLSFLGYFFYKGVRAYYFRIL